MSEIDPVEFGKLVNAVETMAKQMTAMATEIDSLKQTLSGGKGIVLGMMIAAGGVGAMASKFVEGILK